MVIRARCAKCGKALNIPDEMAGKRGKCPFCGKALAIPPDAAVAAGDEIEVMPVGDDSGGAAGDAAADDALAVEARPTASAERAWTAPGVRKGPPSGTRGKRGALVWLDFLIVLLGPVLFGCAAAVLYMYESGDPVPRALASEFGSKGELPLLTASTPLRLRAVRGAKVRFEVLTDRYSINGRWAAPKGIGIRLSNPAADFTWEKTLSKAERGWGEYITATELDKNDRPLLELDLTVPDAPGPRAQRLSGEISGEFVFPESRLEKGEGKTWLFKNRSAAVKLPVELEILATRPLTHWQLFTRAAVVYALLIAAWGLFRFILKVRG
jgi:hypothetical protein